MDEHNIPKKVYLLNNACQWYIKKIDHKKLFYIIIIVYKQSKT